MKYQFIIVAPNWDDKSNGINILYKVSGNIIDCGYDCHIYLMGNQKANERMPEEYKQRIVDKIDYNDASNIVILPDAVSYKQSLDIKSKNRVWFLLNKPMVLTKEKIHIQDNDVFISYSKIISQYDKQYFLNSKIKYIDEIIFKIKNHQIHKKNQIAFYTGKARKINKLFLWKLRLFLNVKIIPLTRELPECKKDLLRILAESRMLVSCDPLTNLLYEATLCKTPAFVLDNYYNINFRDYNIPLTGIFTNKKFISKYFFKGITEAKYNNILDNYYRTTANHLEETKKIVNYIISEFSSNEKSHRAKENRLRNECYLAEYNRLKIEKNLLNPKLSNYTSIISLRVLWKLLRLGILNNTIKVACYLTFSTRETRKSLRKVIVQTKQKIINDYICKI